MTTFQYVGTGAALGAGLGALVGLTFRPSKSSTSQHTMLGGDKTSLVALKDMDYDMYVICNKLNSHSSHCIESFSSMLGAVVNLCELHEGIMNGTMSCKSVLMRTAARYAEQATDFAGIASSQCPPSKQYEFDSIFKELQETIQARVGNIHQEIKSKVF